MHRSRLGHRSGLFLVFSLLLALPALGQKLTSQPGGLPGAAPTFRIIPGNPLTIHVGSDGSFQIFNAAVPGQGQVYPGNCTSVADMGIFADFNGVLYAPDFGNHACGSATGGIGTFTPWTQVSLSAVTGTGTTADPYTVVIVLDAAATGIRLTVTVTYVNSENFLRFAKTVTSTAAASVTLKVFLGADLFLAGSDSGIPYLHPTSQSVGGQSCSGPSYTILFIPITPASAYSANSFGQVWTEIGAAQLSNTVASGCIDNGAALQWDRTVTPGGSVTISSGSSFGTIPGIAGGPTAAVPTLDTKALVVLAILLAAVGFVVVRRLLG